MAVENVYDLMMRLTVSDEASRVLVEIGKKVAELGEHAARTAEELEKVGRAGAANLQWMRSILLLGGGGLLALGGGALGAIAGAAKIYEPIEDQMAKLREMGLGAAEAQQAYNAALAQTGEHPAWGTMAQNLEIFSRLQALTHDTAESLRLMPTIARYASLMGGSKAAEAMITAGQLRGMGTPEEEARLEKMFDTWFRQYEASGRVVTPEMQLRLLQRSKGARTQFSDEFIATMGALAATTAGAGGRQNVGASAEALVNRMDELEPMYRQWLTRTQRFRGRGLPPPMPERLLEIQDVFGTLPEGMLRRVGEDPAKWIENELMPALIKKFGTDKERISAAITRIVGPQGADIATRLAFDSPAWRAAMGLQGPSQLELQRRQERLALTPEQAEAERLAKSAKDLRQAIYNEFTAIDAKIGESATKFEVEMESKVLKSMQSVFGWLQGQKQEDIDRWVANLGTAGIGMAAGGAAALALAAAMTGTGGLVLALGAVGAAAALAVPYFDQLEQKIFDLHDWIASLFGLQPRGGTGRDYGPTEVPYEIVPGARGGVRRLAPLPHFTPYDIQRELAPRGFLPAVPAPPTGSSAIIIAPLGGVRPGQPGYAPQPREPAPPEGASGVPPLGTTLPPAQPGTSMPQMPSIPFIPTSAEGDIRSQSRQLADVMRVAIQTGTQRESRPIVVSLNIDGQRISEALSTQLAALMEQPGQAPYHDGWRGWQSPDMQMTTT